MPKREPANWLPAAIRKAVIRETFEAITVVGFTKWKAEEILGWGYEPGEEDRQHYFQMFEKDHFAEFRKVAATATDDRLLDARDDWLDKANSMGLKEWQEILSQGKGGQPFYDLLAQEVAEEKSRDAGPGGTATAVTTRAEWDSLRQEIAHDEELRREMWERGEKADRPTSPKSVLGYDLPDPSPTPAPDRTRGR